MSQGETAKKTFSTLDEGHVEDGESADCSFSSHRSSHFYEIFRFTLDTIRASYGSEYLLT